jgi:hypothetical protein
MRLRLLLVLAALLCAFCSKKGDLAGGFDDVENPAIAVSLLDSLQKPFGAGEIRIYARFQNPWKDSLPLIDQTVAAGTALKVRDTALVSAMDRAVARGTPWPSRDTLEFNLVAAGAQAEAFLGDFRMIKTGEGGYRFSRRTGGTTILAGRNGVLETGPVLAAPVFHQRGNIGARGLELGLRSLFVPGSPYRAAIAADGSFEVPRMARGLYDVKSESGEPKIYTAADSLEAGAEYLPSNWSEADLIWVE